jgi:hypothetical protein
MSWMRIIFAASLCFAMSAQAATLHISPTGDDDAAGTTDKPFATLERARDEARRLRRDQKVAEPLDIVVHPGTYALSATL